MNVELPDGTVIEDVPDNITKAELIARLKKNGYDTSGLEAPASDPELARLKNAQSTIGATPSPKTDVDRIAAISAGQYKAPEKKEVGNVGEIIGATVGGLGGTGVGATAGFMVAGPVGAVVGGIIGSLLGSTAGTAAGSSYDLSKVPTVSEEEASQLMKDRLVTNAMWDVGGNVFFLGAGRVVRVVRASPTLVAAAKNLFGEAKPAQAFVKEAFEKAGGSITKGQDKGATGILENVARTTNPVEFERQAAKNKEAVKASLDDIIDRSLADVEKDPQKAGELIQNAVKGASRIIKDKYTPFYQDTLDEAGNVVKQSILKEHGTFLVDMKRMKAWALNQLENDSQKKYTVLTAGARRLLQSISEGADSLPFHEAHDLSSRLFKHIKDIGKPGVATKSDQAIIAKTRSFLDDDMQKAADNGSDAAKAFKKTYDNVQMQYATDVEDLSERVLTKALKTNPEKVGELFANGSGLDISDVDDLQKVLAKARVSRAPWDAVDDGVFQISPEDLEKLATAAVTKIPNKTMNAIRYGYISKLFPTAEAIAGLNTKLEKDVVFKRVFEKVLTPEQQRDLKQLSAISDKALSSPKKDLFKAAGTAAVVLVPLSAEAYSWAASNPVLTALLASGGLLLGRTALTKMILRGGRSAATAKGLMGGTTPLTVQGVKALALMLEE